MKTTKTKNEASAPANVRPSSSVSKTDKPTEANQRELVKHRDNRNLSTETVLNYLQARLPKQYAIAEVVGKWIWLTASKKHGFGLGLWALGFHWNSRREVWQHPCGQFGSSGSHPTDPRERYGSYFAASKTA